MAFASEVIDFDSVLKIKYFYNLDLSIAYKSIIKCVNCFFLYIEHGIFSSASPSHCPRPWNPDWASKFRCVFTRALMGPCACLGYLLLYLSQKCTLSLPVLNARRVEPESQRFGGRIGGGSPVTLYPWARTFVNSCCGGEFPWFCQ